MVDEDIKKALFDRCHKLIDKWTRSCEKVNGDGAISHEVLSNIGITYNNKMLEIVNKFKNNNYKLSDTSLFLVVVDYLNNFLMMAEACIIRYSIIASEFDNIEAIHVTTYVNKADELIRTCNKLDDELFSFDFNEQMPMLLEDYMSGYKKSDYSKYPVYNQMCSLLANIFNDELNKLNIKYTLANNVDNKESSKHFDLKKEDAEFLVNDLLHFMYDNNWNLPLVTAMLEFIFKTELSKAYLYSDFADVNRYNETIDNLCNMDIKKVLVDGFVDYVIFYLNEYNIDILPKVEMELEVLGLNDCILDIKAGLENNQTKKLIKN